MVEGAGNAAQIALARWQGGVDEKLAAISNNIEAISRELHDAAEMLGDFRVTVQQTRRDVDTLRADVNRMATHVLDEAKVAQLIGTALTNAQARGWTIRDRILQYTLGAMTLASIFVGFYVATHG